MCQNHMVSDRVQERRAALQVRVTARAQQTSRKPVSGPLLRHGDYTSKWIVPGSQTTRKLASATPKEWRQRGYAPHGAVIFQSVPAEACRPTGPADADASPLSSNLLESKPCTPLSFINNMTRSTDSAPA